jgi:hypothetical protein
MIHNINIEIEGATKNQGKVLECIGLHFNKKQNIWYKYTPIEEKRYTIFGLCACWNVACKIRVGKRIYTTIKWQQCHNEKTRKTVKKHKNNKNR